jgi:hypothetical protein
LVWSNAEAMAMVASSTDTAIEIRSSIAVLPAIDIRQRGVAQTCYQCFARFQPTRRRCIIHPQLPFWEVFEKFHAQG